MGDAVCVAMATCDGARHLPEQLASIAAQTRLPDRLVVADDASSDPTPEIVAEFAATAPFPVELHRHGDRLGAAGNFGRVLALCSGDIVLLADQDDRWHPDKIAVLAEALFSDPGTNLVFSDLDLVDVAGQPLGETQWGRLGFDGDLRAAFAADPNDVLLRFNVVTGAAAALRQEVVDIALPVPDEWLADEWLAVVAAATGAVVFIERSLVDYRQHGSQHVGGAVTGLWSQLRHARRHMGKDYLARQARRSAVAVDRLEALDNELPGVVAAWRDRAEHYRRRAEMPWRPDRRIGAVRREWRAGHYRSFGYGWRSAAQDILLR